MAFYSPDPGMGQILSSLVEDLGSGGRPWVFRQLSITWLRYPRSLLQRGANAAAGGLADLPLRGASWAGERPRYPASVVKLVYLIAAEVWLQRQLLEDGEELRRALADMIRDSSNDATGLVLDLLSGTTSGPSLPPERFGPWMRQRQLVNGWLASLGWPELEGCNACQKTWGDGPYGRELDFYGDQQQNRNRLSTDATARLLQSVIAAAIVSPPASARMQALLSRSLDPAQRAADPENQVDGFIGAGLPSGSRLWSKAGWMSQARHDAAYVEVEGADPLLLVVFSEGKQAAVDEELLPAITAALVRACRQQ
ncbi:MAG: serine hydrolase [Cyanobium sp.]